MSDTTLLTARNLYAVVRDESGDQVEPADMVLTIEDPSGLVSEPEVLEVDQAGLAEAAEALGETLTGVTGVYKATVTPHLPGTWKVHWQSSTPTIAIDSWFQVPWPLIPSLVSQS